MDRKKVYILFIAILFSLKSYSQRSSAITPSQLGDIMLIEKKMQRIGYQFLTDTSQERRVKGARDFIKLLVQAMKVENSFQYSFDSIPYMAKVIPEDSSFKIYTFQVMLDNYTFYHYGCIQLNRKNIQLIPLHDFSDTFPVTPQYTLTNKNWLGAVYYKVITKKLNNKPIYFLFGFDQNDVLSDKKYVEPMWLEGDTVAKFGIPIFDKTYMVYPPQKPKKFMSEEVKPDPPYKVQKTFYRYVLEYRKNANASLRYNEEKDMIVHDHLPPLDGKTEDIGFNKAPDGTYEGLRWDKSKWTWIDYLKLTDQEINTPIRPLPIKDSKLMPEN